MQADTINIDSRQIYSGNLRYLTEKTSYSSSTNNDWRNDSEVLSKDQKRSIVSEKLDTPSVDTHNDLRFQGNAPIAKLLDVIKNFNETAKVETPQFKDSKFISNAQFTELSQKAANETPIGYYVVIDDNKKSAKQKTIKGRFELIREKIAKTYNLGFRKENGTLVNLTA